MLKRSVKCEDVLGSKPPNTGKESGKKTVQAIEERASEAKKKKKKGADVRALRSSSPPKQGTDHFTAWTGRSRKPPRLAGPASHGEGSTSSPAQVRPGGHHPAALAAGGSAPVSKLPGHPNSAEPATPGGGDPPTLLRA